MFGKLIGYILLFAFYLPFTLQSLLAALLERKRINAPFHKLLPAIFLSPLFMIVYAISICLGVVSRPTWKKIRRNVAPSPAEGQEEPPQEGKACDASDQEIKERDDPPRRRIISQKHTEAAALLCGCLRFPKRTIQEVRSEHGFQRALWGVPPPSAPDFSVLENDNVGMEKMLN